MRTKLVTKAGQIKEGDLLLLRSEKGIQAETAKQVIRPGSTDESNGEEIVFKVKKNHYFITSMVLDGSSWVKEVQIVKES